MPRLVSKFAGTSYGDFVVALHLPAQLADVDPIVASFCGGAVGVVSCLLVIEVGNVTRQQKNRCVEAFSFEVCQVP